MGIETKINVKFRGVNKELMERTRQSMEEAMTLLKGDIIRRTKSGIDADGKAFAPYSPSYAADKASGAARKKSTKKVKKKIRFFKSFGSVGAKKAKSGKSGGRSKSSQYGPSIKVDLTLWGNMLADITEEVKITRGSIVARLFFASSKQAQKAKSIQSGVYFGKRRSGKARKFFAMSPKQRTSIRGKLKTRYNNMVKELIKG